MNVFVTQVIPRTYTPNQTMYPGAPEITNRHEFHFSGLEGKTQAQIWMWDVLSSRFMQKSVMMPITNGMIVIPISIVLASEGVMCLQFSTGYPVVVSNKFNYKKADYAIIGGSTNLGEVTGDMPFSQLTAEQISTPTATVIPTKKKNRR